MSARDKIKYEYGKLAANMCIFREIRPGSNVEFHMCRI